MSTTVPFSLRVRLGQCEIEISGSRDDVMRTISDLSSLVDAVAEAFSRAGVETSLHETVTQSASTEQSIQSSSSMPVAARYPSIQSSGGCGDAVLRLLATDWGRVSPRTLPEMVEALRVNAVHFPVTTLSGVLNWLVRRGRVKRWKTDKGYVYVLAQTNAATSQQSMQTQPETVDGSAGGG